MSDIFCRIFKTIILFIGITSSSVYAQQIVVVNGVVLDQNKEPIVGASVVENGTTNGILTDINGDFSIKIQNPQNKLKISFIGYEPKMVAIPASGKIKVMLNDNVQNLDEVVVVAFGSQKKETVVGAISTMKSDQIKQAPVSNLSNALAGKLPGLVAIQRSGEPGRDESEIFIRGISTLDTKAAQPLCLVDGIERPFAQIDPSEVESISILKDASATAVYGVRGANGVILVTTKRGMEGPAEIDFSAQVGYQEPTRKPQTLNALESATLWNEAYFTDNGSHYYSPEQFQTIRDVMAGVAPADSVLRYPNTYWFDELANPFPVQQQYNINVRGGTKAVRYFVSAGYFNQGSMFRSFPSYHGDRKYNSNFSFERYNFRSNVDIDINKNFSATLNLAGRVEDVNSPFTYDGSDVGPGVFQQLYGLGTLSVPISYPGVGLSNAILGSNPVGYLTQGGFTNQTKSTIETSIILKYNLDFIVKGLTARASGSFDSKFNYLKSFKESYQTYERNWEIKDKPVYTVMSELKPLEYSRENYWNDNRIYFEFGLDYEYKRENHRVTALALYNQQQYRYEAVIPFVYQGLVGRLTYDFQGKYLTEFNMGYNGSENFAKGHRFGFFPAFSAGWVLSEEDFIRNIDFISWLKLRGSYGEVGNDKLYLNGSQARFLYLTDYKETGGYKFGVNAERWEPGIQEGTVANTNVTWERARKSNVALEGGFLNQKIGFVADFFRESRDNILITRQKSTPSIVGAALPAVNKGKTQCQGFELELNHNNKIQDFTYWVKGNYSFARSKVISVDEPASLSPNLRQAGQRIGQFFGYTSLGLFQTEEEIAGAPSQNGFGAPPMVGDRRYLDYNNDNVINSEDQHPIGFSSIPEITYAFSLGASYRNFDLSVLFQGVGNVSKFFWRESIYEFASGKSVQPIHLGRWSPFASAEENAKATWPRLHTSDASRGQNMQTCDATLFNGNYLRLKNVELGYTFPTQWLSKIYIKNLRLYATGLNLVTWDKLKIRDPETDGTGSVYPQMKVINIGVNIKF